VYDITKEKSYESVSRWMDELKHQAEPDIVIMLVGNKLDIVQKNQQQRKVTRDEAETFARENSLLFEETSATEALNVTDVFETLLQGMIVRKIKSL
jgi:GTPase SAR1 family protein